MKAREFKNGNINITVDRSERFASAADLIFELSEALFWKDTYPVGEEYCLSNYHTGQTWYNCRLDRCYTVSSLDLESLGNGKPVKLAARIPDMDDREDITSWEEEK